MRLRGSIIWLGFSVLLFTACIGKQGVSKAPGGLDSGLKETHYYNLFTNATKHALFGNNKTAIPLYEACIEDFPQQAAPYYQLSSIYLRENDNDKALDYAKKAYNLDPGNRWYKEHLGNIYHYLKMYDDAIDIYLELLKENPDDELVYNVSLLYSDRGKFRESLEVIGRISDEYRNSYEVLMLKHKDYHSMGMYDSAIYELETLVQVFSEGVDSYGILAEYLAEIGRIDYARDVYMDILRRDSTNGLALLSFSEFYLRQDKVDSAFCFLEQAFCCSDLLADDKLGTIINLMQDPVITEKYADTILKFIEYIGEEEKGFSYYAAKADLYMNMRNFFDAKPILDSVLLYEKENYLVWEQTLRVNANLGNHNEVIRISDEALLYFPNEPNVYVLRANSYSALEEYDLAIVDLEKVLDYELVNFQKIQVYALLAEAYHTKGRNSDSDEYFERILELDEYNTIIRNNYAYYLAVREERLEYAEKLSRYTIDTDPLNPTFLDTYGWILFKMGRFEEAKKYIEAAIRNGSDRNPEVLEHYGDIMIELGRCDEAIEAFEKILEIQSNSEIKMKMDSVQVKCK